MVCKNQEHEEGTRPRPKARLFKTNDGQMLISQIQQYFMLKKCEKLLGGWGDERFGGKRESLWCVFEWK